MEKIENNYKRIAIVIIIIGIIFRLIYISYTSIEDRQHDMKGNFGHLGYIKNIYETGKLPETNRGQFYHPPLHHLISANFVKIQNLAGLDLKTAL